MVSLQKISNKHADTVSKHAKISKTDVEKMIKDSDSKSFDGRFFEMYVVMSGEEIVGLISLFEHSASIVSIGPEIFTESRKLGYATKAMQMAMDIARSIGYKIVFQQVRVNNIASIKLHEKLGFETDNIIYKNRKNNEIFIYLKSI